MKRIILILSLAMILCITTVLTSAFTSNALEYENETMMSLPADEGERPILAYIKDNEGFYNGSWSNGLDVIAAQKAVCSAAMKNYSTIKWTDQGTFLGLKLVELIKDNSNHTLTYNDQLAILGTGSERWIIKGTKTIRNVDTTGKNGNDGIWFFSVDDNLKTPLITVSGNVTFINGAISYDEAQYNKKANCIEVNPTSTFRVPMMLNNGTLTINATSLRAGGNANYVLTNNGTATLTGGGSLQGGARKNSTSSLVINNHGRTLNINHYVLNASYLSTNANIRVGNAITNSGTCKIIGNTWCAIGQADTGINNTSTGVLTIDGSGDGIPHISSCKKGIDNENSLTLTNADINNNAIGINNIKDIKYSGGEIYNNTSYGINNSGTVNQSGGRIYNNKGAKPDSTDTAYVGVYQGGTYTVSGDSKIYENNSLYLPTASSQLKQNGTLSGRVMLTTNTSDRQIGRELVIGNSNNYAKYSLAYGNDGAKANARFVKDSSEEGGGRFSGNKVGIRPGNLIYGKTLTSCYLSGEYNISYLPNAPKGGSVSPNMRPNTTFYYRENANALFGTNTYFAEKSDFLGYARSSFAATPEYTSNYFFSGANTFTGNRQFYGVWKDRIEDNIDRTITYKPNGAVDINGNPCLDVNVNKPAPLSDPVTLLDGTYAGGTRLASDITFTKGDVRYDLSEYVPSNTSSNSVQYRAKAGDIVNNLGNTTTLSKFRGWGVTPDGRNAFNGNVTLTSESLWGNYAYNLDNFVFYANWDEFPQIDARDIVVSTGSINREELTKNIIANDREDGTITNKVRIINYDEVVNALSTSKGFTVIYEVTDSAGNTTRAFAKISIEDEYDGKALNVISKQVRCINRHAYNTFNSDEGGCLPNSPFYNEPGYANVLLSCFDNLDNNTPVARYTLTRKERQDISAHMHEVGLEHMYEKNVLQYYVDKYMDSEHQNRSNEYNDSKLFFLRISAQQMMDREMQELDRLKALRNQLDLSRAYR